MTRKMNKSDFEKFLNNADALTTTKYNSLGWYDAVVWYDNKSYRCNIEALAGDSVKGEVQEITEEKTDELVKNDLLEYFD